MLDSASVKRMACECGADLAGVAAIERFATLPPEANPRFIQPDARSVIVLGFRIPRGALRGMESGTAWQTYGGANPAGGFCVEATYQLTRILESEGWEAVPLYAHSTDLRNQGVRAHPDKPEPNVILDMEFAAHAAGLGEIGRGKLFLTPQFGPRQIFTALVTDLELAPDAPFAESLCDNCGACAAACPAKALNTGETRASPLAEGEARWYALHVESCQVCKTGVTHLPFCGKTEPFRAGAACGRACVAHLEDGGRLSRKFAHPFRAPAAR
jgi:epoxyqueuosine reductase QueG